MCWDITEKYIISNVTGRLILRSKVKNEEDASLLGFPTSILDDLARVLLRDVSSIHRFPFRLLVQQFPPDT